MTNPVAVHTTDPLSPDQAYDWPLAPLRSGGTRDLSLYPEDRCMALATTLLEPDGEHAFIAVSNPKLGLLLVYVFPHEVFPWTTLWYEHEAAELIVREKGSDRDVRTPCDWRISTRMSPASDNELCGAT